MTYRNDPRWVAAHKAVAVTTSDRDADYVRRMRAAVEMFEIESDWERQTAWALQLRAS